MRPFVRAVRCDPPLLAMAATAASLPWDFDYIVFALWM